MRIPRARLTRILAIGAVTAGLSAGSGGAVALADPPSWSNAGGTPATDSTARDEHRPAGAGSGRKVG